MGPSQTQICTAKVLQVLAERLERLRPACSHEAYSFSTASEVSVADPVATDSLHCRAHLWTWDTFPTAQDTSVTKLMELSVVQLRRPSGCHKAVGAGDARAWPLRILPGAIPRGGRTGCSEEMGAAYSARPSCEHFCWCKIYSSVKIVPLKVGMLKAETQQMRRLRGN